MNLVCNARLHYQPASDLVTMVLVLLVTVSQSAWLRGRLYYGVQTLGVGGVRGM